MLVNFAAAHPHAPATFVTAACLHCGVSVPPNPHWSFCSVGCAEAVQYAAAQQQQHQQQHYGAGPMGYRQDSVGSNSGFGGNSSFHTNLSSGGSMGSLMLTPMASIAEPPTPTTAAASAVDGMCQCCVAKTAPAGSALCSKRCAWHLQCRCPQCGRDRGNALLYCSHACAAQAVQANWCGFCGVRQILSGATTCGFHGCVVSAAEAMVNGGAAMGAVAAAVAWGAPARRQSSYNNNSHNGHNNNSINHHGGGNHSGANSLAGSRGASFRRTPAVPRHELLPHDDKTRASLVASFNASLGAALGSSPSRPLGGVVAVIKITPDVARRKTYLAYRSQVERVMTTGKAVKYGHGGEGNEQRRFFPFRLECGLGVSTCGGGAAAAVNANTNSNSNAGARGAAFAAIAAASSSNLGSSLGSNHSSHSSGGHSTPPPAADPVPCQSETCDCCVLLQHGMLLQRMHRGSHYSTSSVAVAAPWCTPGSTGLKALVVARVVVGNANVLRAEYGQCPPIEVPSDPTQVHSTVVTDGIPENDGMYVFRDDAVDPLFVILFQ